MNKYLSKLLVIVVVVFLVGVFVGHSLLGQKVSEKGTSQTTPPQKNALFQSQTASIQGKITKVEGSSISVESSQGQSGTFTASNRVVIYKFPAGSRQASASADLKSIELDKKVLLALTLINDNYQIASISYLPPIASASAKLSPPPAGGPTPKPKK